MHVCSNYLTPNARGRVVLNGFSFRVEIALRMVRGGQLKDTVLLGG